MVRTSKGPAEKSKPEVAAKAPADKATMARANDIDDETWDRITEMARSQRTTTGEVIRRAIVAQFGDVQPIGGYHSGQATDPSI